MNALTWFGLFAVTAMLLCYSLEARSAWFILGFSAACALGSVYGFLQGAWPFGAVEAVWSAVAFRRWWLTQGCPLFCLIKEFDEMKEQPQKRGFNFFMAFFLVAVAMSAIVLLMNCFNHA